MEFLPQVQYNIAYTSFTKEWKNALITGFNGNIGQACVNYISRHPEWLFESASREYKRDLANWEKTEEWIIDSIPFDLVVMAHGVQRASTLETMDRESWEYIIDNNLNSCASLTSALLRHKKINPKGLFVYFSSIQASQPREGRAAYAAAKAGIEGLTRAAAVELGSIGARAICLRIGQMTLPMKGIKFSNEQMERFQEMMPLPLIDARNVAELIFQLYEQPSLTGEIIEISGGHHLQIWR